MSTITERLAGRLRGLRTGRELSLDDLAARSGVSRSAISLIERGESSPTAVVLEKLAAALDVSLASLFDDDGDGADALPGPVVRRRDQPIWTDPASGYRRRNVTLPDERAPFRLVEISFPAGASVQFDAPNRTEPLFQYVWLLAGTIELSIGAERYTLAAGDCAGYFVDGPTSFHNPGRSAARYLVAQHQPAPTPRRAVGRAGTEDQR